MDSRNLSCFSSLRERCSDKLVLLAVIQATMLSQRPQPGGRQEKDCAILKLPLRDFRAMNRLSACLITLNEERNLSRSLSSLQETVAEISILYSGSPSATSTIPPKHAPIFST